MRRMLHRNRIPVRIDCTCHDPTVFGHITCTRAETQPNNSIPRPPDSVFTNRISAAGLNAASISCALHEQIRLIGELDATMHDTTQRVTDLTDLIGYINRWYGPPPSHG